MSCLSHHCVNGFVSLLTVGPHFIVNPIASQEVVINGTFMLSCGAEGFPRPSIVWYMNGTMISDGVTRVKELMNVNSSTLARFNAGFDYSGMYYCQAVSSEFADLNVTSTVAIITVVGKLVSDIEQLLMQLLSMDKPLWVHSYVFHIYPHTSIMRL